MYCTDRRLFRDPKDSAVSAYWHICDWIFTSDEMDLNEFVDYFAASEVPEKYRFFAGMQLRHQGKINSVESRL